MSNTSELQGVLADIKQAVDESELPVVIFDLDDTLFSTAARDLRIIREFAADHHDEFPDFVGVAAPLTLADMRWNATDALQAAGLPSDSSSLKPFVDYWTGTFFSDRYVALDLPIPGAVDFVNACHATGALVFYLTGRGVSDRGLTVGMEQGTTRALTTRGFPFWTGRCELTLKVDKDQPDDEFKAEALSRVRSLRGRVIATFDNEPANANMFLEHFPDARNFWVKTAWDPSDDQPNGQLITIADFRRKP